MQTLIVRRQWIVVVTLVVAAASLAAQSKRAPAPKSATPAPKAGPVVVVDTVKGQFEFETYPELAPTSVAHILELVKKNFYSGLRVHRVEPKFVVQWGDTRTRNMMRQDEWGKAGGGGSGKPVGVAELSKKGMHVRGAVGLAHAGDPAQADSQIYVMLGNRPALDEKYAIIGKVTSGMTVVDKLQVTDVIKKMSIK